MPVLGAVGPLQFEVLQYRLQSEYGAESRLENAPWSLVRWLAPDVTEEAIAGVGLPTGCRLAHDDAGHRVILFGEPWAHELFTHRYPEIALTARPPALPNARAVRVRATA